MLAEAQVDASRLGDENGGQRQVQAGAVEVEAVAGGHHEGDDFPRHADGLHRPGQRGLRAGGDEGNGNRLCDRADESAERHARHQRHRQQHQQKERGQRNVERGQQLREVHQDTQAHVPHRVRDRRPLRRWAQTA